MATTRILVLRHAEKTGDKTDPLLNDAGFLRAARLADYIPTTFGMPNYLIATADTQRSQRPRLTITPLSEKTGVAIEARYADHDAGLLASELVTDPRYLGALTVVCWHHGEIPHLMLALGATYGTYPQKWPDEVFNLILDTTFAGGVAPNVTIVTQPF